ncbi:hypothetical protein [uncultured Shewanella sp.]|uniref:hypothetical protein n=1 Tax=uncultured Shewanella sp. TaxID=173975 RepID=UPI00261084CF|nr:hypothetical protein [uncultured Shewanella sp.]
MTPTFERKITSEEKEFLVGLLKSSPSDLKRLKEILENFLIIWSASLIGLVLVWIATVWLINFFITFDYGLKSQYSFYILFGFSIPTCLYSLISTTKWAKSWPDDRLDLKKDIDGDKVLDTTYEVKGVKRFQEQEHGGLIYFLLLHDNKVLTLYDYESVEIEMQGGDPLTSNFKPRSKLRIVKAPNTGYFITQEFVGNELLLPEPTDLFSSPDKWPEGESWCNIPWNELESRLIA